MKHFEWPIFYGFMAIQIEIVHETNVYMYFHRVVFPFKMYVWLSCQPFRFFYFTFFFGHLLNFYDIIFILMHSN